MQPTALTGHDWHDGTVGASESGTDRSRAIQALSLVLTFASCVKTLTMKQEVARVPYDTFMRTVDDRIDTET